MNVLFLTHRLPFAPNRGDRIRAYFLLQQIARFADVSLFSLVHDAEEASRAGSITSARTVVTSRVPRFVNAIKGAARLPTSRPLTHSLLNAADVVRQLEGMVRTSRPDVVLAYCSGMAQFALQSPLADIPFVLDLVDVDSEKWRSLAERTSLPLKWIYQREARTLAAFERTAALRARSVLVVSDREAMTMRELAPEAHVEVVRNGVDVESFARPQEPTVSADVVFCGVMNYAPNVEAVRWFADCAWPRVRAARPDARFVVVGADPTSEVTSLATRDSSIEVTGRVDAVQPYLWRAAVSIAPLRVARGIQNKVLEALSAGLPVVATTPVIQGLPDGISRGCVEASDPIAFADAVIALLGETPERRGEIARASGIQTRSWAGELGAIEGILRRAIL